jgi:hypothetical protein
VFTADRPASDLVVATFFALRDALFDEGGAPRTFPLRDKRNTQDDPFDEHLCEILGNLVGASCVKAPGPLITPDLVVLVPEACSTRSRRELRDDLKRIVAFEVKKLERTERGTIARLSGMDYNTTPPCGTVRVVAADGKPLDIRGFYVFVCQEPIERVPGTYRLTAFALCDGNLLNSDFEYYLSIVGERVKEIAVGSYADGANRTRPMLIFVNPLAAPQLAKHPVLVHPEPTLHEANRRLRRIGVLRRKERGGNERTFYCYSAAEDVNEADAEFDLLDPFPQPARTTATQPRGRFRLNVRPLE